MEGKACTKCGEWKAIDEFPKEKKRGKMVYRADCKKCRNAYKLELKKKNPKYAENQKRLHEEWLKTPEGKEYIRLRGIEDRKKPQWKVYQKKGKENYRNSEKGKAKEKAYQLAYTHTEEYRAKNRTSLIEYRKTEKYKQWLHSENGKEIRYRARLKRRSHEHDVKFSPIQRKAILDRDNWICQYCGCKVHDRSTSNWNTHDKAHIDHIIPLTEGGTSEWENLQVLCRSCNLRKSNKMKDKIKKQLKFDLFENYEEKANH